MDPAGSSIGYIESSDLRCGGINHRVRSTDHQHTSYRCCDQHHLPVNARIPSLKRAARAADRPLLRPESDRLVPGGATIVGLLMALLV